MRYFTKTGIELKVVGNIEPIRVTTKRLTKGELNKLELRVEEIEGLIDLCGPNDDDVLGNLELELTMICETIENSLAAKPKKRVGV